MAEQRHDPINHPSHYTSHPSGVEAIQITEHHTFCVGNAMKYMWRAGLKGSPEELRAKEIEDLKKARWYLTREIERLEKELSGALGSSTPGAACAR